MAKLASIYGDLASSQNLQLLVNNALSLFNTPVWKRYFDWGNPTLSIDFTTVIGKSRIEAMASVVDRDASAPLRSRAGLERLQGQVPAIKEKFKLSEKQYREFLSLRALQIPGQNPVLDLIFGDLRIAGNAAHKRLDAMVYQALSSGKINLTTTNNPDGIVTSADVDLLMPSANKFSSVIAWGTAATATPMVDIMAVVDAADAKGVRYAKMMMDRATFNKFRATADAQKYLSGFFGLKSTQKVAGTLEQWNEYLTADGMPTIEIVDSTVGIEKDGAITAVKAWTANAVTFVPAGKLGIIHNALPIEKIQPVASVSYADFDRALLSKWQENDPFAEYTQVELNAFPGWETIEMCAILDSNVTA
jgi:hypothetical protein